MSLSVEIKEQTDRSCLARINLEQVWQTKSKYTDHECRNVHSEARIKYIRYDTSEAHRIITIPCDQLSEGDTSTVRTTKIEEIPCNKRIKYYIKGCCWIPFIEHGNTEGQYDTTFIFNSSKRADGSFNRVPRIFIPPVLKVPVNKEETNYLYPFDPDGDRVECRQPIAKKDCQLCDSVDNLKNDKVLRINKDCTLTTNFKVPQGKSEYFKAMIVVEEFEKSTMLSSGTFLLLLKASEMNCNERSKTLIKLEPNDKILIHGKQYNMTIITRPPCGNVTYKSSIFSLIPDGANVSDSKIGKNGEISKTMSFEANENLCNELTQICAYSIDKDDFQSKADCKKILCRNYESLKKSNSFNKALIAAGITACFLLLSGLIALTVVAWKRKKQLEESEDSETSQSETSENESSDEKSETFSKHTAPSHNKQGMLSMMNPDDEE